MKFGNNGSHLVDCFFPALTIAGILNPLSVRVQVFHCDPLQDSVFFFRTLESEVPFL